MATCPSGTFFIKSNSNPYPVLDVANHSTEEGDPVVLWTKNGGKNQQWTYQSGYIVNVESGLCLQVQLDFNEEIHAGAPLTQGEKKSAGNNYHQLWTFTPDYGYLMLWDPRSATRLVVSGEGNTSEPGKHATAEELKNFPSMVQQQWVLENGTA